MEEKEEYKYLIDEIERLKVINEEHHILNGLLMKEITELNEQSDCKEYNKLKEQYKNLLKSSRVYQNHIIKQNQEIEKLKAMIVNLENQLEKLNNIIRKK